MTDERKQYVEYESRSGVKAVFLVSDQGYAEYRGKVCKTIRSRDGRKRIYAYVGSEGGVRQTLLVQLDQLVAGAFLEDDPDPEKKYVKHRDGDLQNCAASNLYYGRKKEKCQNI